MYYSIGDLIWIPDNTMGIISESVKEELSGEPAQYQQIEGPVYGLVVAQKEPHQNWIKASFEKHGKQNTYYIQKKDVRKHTEV
jgi:hypothetical protein